jgi:hypothetical protein
MCRYLSFVGLCRQFNSRHTPLNTRVAAPPAWSHALVTSTSFSWVREPEARDRECAAYSETRDRVKPFRCAAQPLGVTCQSPTIAQRRCGYARAEWGLPLCRYLSLSEFVENSIPPSSANTALRAFRAVSRETP